MKFVDLPYELFIEITSKLVDKQDIKAFLLTNRKFYAYSLIDSFWFDLCQASSINYKHPSISFKELYLSGQVNHMCCHLNQFKSILNCLEKPIVQSTDKTHFDICLSCHSDHCQRHAIMLKLSRLHVLDIWCNSCNKVIGYDGFKKPSSLGTQSERHIVTKILRKVMNQPIKRREIEYHLYSTNLMNQVHIVDKNWYLNWLEYIEGKSHHVPGVLDNQKLYRQDGTLNPELVLGQDFELVSSLTRWYIERIYGVQDYILSANELPIHDPEYCRLVHKIKIRHQINQVARYPAFVLE